MKNITLILLLALLNFMACRSSLNGLVVKEINSKEIVSANGEVQKVPKAKNEQSTFFLVRHAEKQKGKDPALTPEGEERAKHLAAILKGRPLKQVFATNYNRTKMTAAPSAEDQAATMGSYSPKSQAAMVSQLLKQGGGYNYLIVGHSNTIPELLNLFAGKEVYKDIPETEYDNLFMVITSELGKAQIFEFKY